MIKTTRIILNKEKDFLILYEVDKAGFIVNNKLHTFKSFNTSFSYDLLIDKINEKEIAFINESLIGTLIKECKIECDIMTLMTSAKSITSVNKIMKNNFKFINDKQYEKGVVKVGTKTIRYLPKKLSRA